MKPPRFWAAGLDPRSREAAPATRALLTPLAALYAYITDRKIRRTTPQDVGLPVICVGNITTGGVGKTPIVAAIRNHLSKAGLRSASLSRGYGGALKGPLLIDPDTHSAADVGDEPLMLSETGESWIGADRVTAAKAMKAAGVQAIIMDDGHQNPSLKKALSLVVIDAAAPFGNGHVIPKGPLREPIMRSLTRANAIILMGDGAVPAPVKDSGRPVWRASLRPDASPPDGPLVAFAGIGRPEKFFDGLKAAGADLVEEIPFADHHPYKSDDMKFLTALADERAAQLITTQKDHVRLPPELRPSILTFPVSVRFESPEALDEIAASILENALE